MKKNRLSKLLASAGVASRRACEELIFAGAVKVNGTIIKLPQHPADWQDTIMVNDVPISAPQEKLYFMLHKPFGYLCTALRTSGTRVVLDLFDSISERLFTVGRLDKDTTGLLLVTNDGHFANKVIHPSANIVKEYLAKTDHDLTADHLKAISSGTLVEGVFVKPKHVKKVRKGTLKIAVSEGKKREVRQLIEEAGLKVLELTRIRIGGLHLGTLPVGQWRPMSPEERDSIFD